MVTDFKILSLMVSAINLQQNRRYILVATPPYEIEKTKFSEVAKHDNIISFNIHKIKLNA